MKNNIIEYLDELFPNPKCELDYNNDWELLIAIMLSAQTTDKSVNKVTKILFNKYKNLEDLMNADIKDLENIIKPIGTFKRKSIYIKQISNILVNEYNSIVPDKYELLIKLPGIGNKTANVFLSEYYNYSYFGVDTHVERVSKRLGIAYKNDNVLNVEKKLKEFFPKDKWSRLHLQLVLFGRYKCKAIKPDCFNCKFKEFCKKKEIN